ncbi:MAG: isoprenylcysteine carboxylmethyltransferase family protein, partial [Bacteroidaceae bacterium]|nr:isoprenylcysteine carboxylmethyltransferase family protein [Bacteroidaceae bacterium]
AGFVLVFALLFLPASTFCYPGGWRLLVLLFIPMLLLGVFLYIYAPDLLEKRLRGKEERVKQKGVVAWSGLLFVASFVVAGFDFRYGWSAMPGWVPSVAGLLLVAAYVMYAEVMRENVWLSRSVEVMDGQQVVSGGLYGIVRHPMYTATILMFLMMPLVLGSWWAFLVMVPYVLVIVRRINDEEELLEIELDGYHQYKQRVKWRLLPLLW